MFASLFQKNSFVFANQLWHFKALNQYSVAYKIRFSLWQTSEQICWNFKYRENVFGKFQGLPRFSYKTFFYSLTKFGSFQSFTNIQWLRRLYLGFWLNSKQAFKKSQSICVKNFWKVSRIASFLIKWLCNRRANIGFLSLVSIFNHSEDSTEAFELLESRFSGIQPWRTV